MIEVNMRIALRGVPQVLTISDGVEALLGCRPDDFLSGRVNFCERIHAHDQDIAARLFAPEQLEGSGKFNIRLRQANGRIRCVRGEYRTSIDAKTGEVLLDLLLQDAKSLQRTMGDASSMMNIRAMMENTDDYIYFKDRNHVFTGASQTLVSLCGPAEHWTDLLGLTDYDVFPEEFADIYYRLEKQVFAGVPVANEVQETLSKDGTRGWVDNRKYPIRDEHGEIIGLYGVARDITALRMQEQVLRERNAQLQLIYDTASVAIFNVDTQGVITHANQRMAEMFACPLERLIGSEYVARTHPSEREQGRRAMLALLAGTTSHVDLERHYWREDQSEFWGHLTGRRMFDADGQTIGLVGVIADITERVRSEEARDQLEAQLRESQKMQAIGTLAGGIAHDFNNALATILGNVELARQDMSTNPLALESLEEIRKAGARARDLVQQILSFSRRQPTERRPTALARVVEESARLLRATLPARVTLEVRCDADLPPAVADASQIQQVLINLATNAAQSMHGGPGRVDIRLDAVALDATLAEKHPALAAMYARHPGKALRLEVIDNGSGIDAANLERIFEPFFTTKPVGEGTGLGLSIVHGILQVHEGAILVSSRPGKGSAFTLYLPAADAKDYLPNPAEMTAAAAPCAGNGQRILYVDDDESLVFLVQRLLDRRGFHISGYTSQHEALAALRADPRLFDLVVSDYNMPGMSGLEVAGAVRAIRSDLPVAVVSGFIDEELRNSAGSAGVKELIFKADAVEDLCDALTRIAQTATRSSNAL